MLNRIKKFLQDNRIESIKNKWIEKQARWNSVQEYVTALIDHLNEIAVVLADKKGIKSRGKIFRIGITHLTGKNFLVPLPLTDHSNLKNVFLDQFMVMPIE